MRPAAMKANDLDAILFPGSTGANIVVGVRRDVFGHDQHALGIHAHLHVVGLLETISARRHDARFFIGEIDLILIAYARLGRFRLG